MGIERRIFGLYFPGYFVARYTRKYLSSNMGYILMYHEVMPDDIATPAWTVVKETNFRWQIEFLKRNYDIVTLDEAEARLTSKESSNRPFVSITFDDGYYGNLNTVLPIMQSMDAPFSVYVATRAIQEQKLYWYDEIINFLKSKTVINYQVKEGNSHRTFTIPAKGTDNQRWIAVQKLLTWLKTLPEKERHQEVARILKKYPPVKPDLRMLTQSELQELASDPLVTIGCHTHGHELLDQLADDTVIETIMTANKLIEAWTGTRPYHFSYPNGNFDERISNFIKDFRFRTAVTTQPRLCRLKDNLFTLPRLGVGRFDLKNHFKAKMAGLSL